MTRPYCVVQNPGEASQRVLAELPTYKAALDEMWDIQADYDGEFDVMKRLPDGTLTTEF